MPEFGDRVPPQPPTLAVPAFDELPAAAFDELPPTAFDELPPTAFDELPPTAFDAPPCAVEPLLAADGLLPACPNPLVPAAGEPATGDEAPALLTPALSAEELLHAMPTSHATTLATPDKKKFVFINRFPSPAWSSIHGDPSRRYST